MSYQNSRTNGHVQQPRNNGITPMTMQHFRAEFDQRERDIVAKLPKAPNDVLSFDAFRASVFLAVEDELKLLECVPHTLWGAIYATAEDGLTPDGKLGYLETYWDKNALGKDQGARVAQWNPMLAGIRLRAMEMGFLIEAEVVCKNDQFEYHKGDRPRIDHGPIKEDQTRGAFIASYAIFRRLSDGFILHREVMGADAVMRVKAQSKNPNSTMWVKFPEEGWKKAAVRRGVKTAVMPRQVLQVITRDDAHFDLSAPAQTPATDALPPAPPPAASKPQTPPAPPPAGKGQPRAPMMPEEFTAKVIATMQTARDTKFLSACGRKALHAPEWLKLDDNQKERIQQAQTARIQELNSTMGAAA